MKTILRHITLAILFTLATKSLMAQGTPPPPPGSHGSGTNQPSGGGAPLDGGVTILLLLGGSYTLAKIAPRILTPDNKEV